MIADPDQASGTTSDVGSPRLSQGDGAARCCQRPIDREICCLQTDRPAGIDPDCRARAHVNQTAPEEACIHPLGGAQRQAGTGALDQPAVDCVLLIKRRCPQCQAGDWIHPCRHAERCVREAIDRHGDVEFGAGGHDQAETAIDVVAGEARLHQRWVDCRGWADSDSRIEVRPGRETRSPRNRKIHRRHVARRYRDGLIQDGKAVRKHIARHDIRGREGAIRNTGDDGSGRDDRQWIARPNAKSSDIGADNVPNASGRRAWRNPVGSERHVGDGRIAGTDRLTWQRNPGHIAVVDWQHAAGLDLIVLQQHQIGRRFLAGAEHAVGSEQFSADPDGGAAVHGKRAATIDTITTDTAIKLEDAGRVLGDQRDVAAAPAHRLAGAEDCSSRGDVDQAAGLQCNVMGRFQLHRPAVQVGELAGVERIQECVDPDPAQVERRAVMQVDR